MCVCSVPLRLQRKGFSISIFNAIDDFLNIIEFSKFAGCSESNSPSVQN